MLWTQQIDPVSAESIKLTSADGTGLLHRLWRAENPRGIVQIIHGGAEHGGRYARLAEQLNTAGFIAVAQDHRGHGRTAAVNGSFGALGDPNGFELILADEQQLTAELQRRFPAAPIVLLGHSLGSLISQRLLMARDNPYAGAALSGSPDLESVIAARPLIEAEIAHPGRHAVSDTLESAIVAGFAAAVPDASTPNDWLSRDPHEVASYAADPLCGFPLCASAWLDLLDAMESTLRAETVKQVRRDIPIYVFSGSADPVHSDGAALRRLFNNYSLAGIADLELRCYPGARHETLNESNRDEVVADLLAWLQRRW